MSAAEIQGRLASGGTFRIRSDRVEFFAPSGELALVVARQVITGVHRSANTVYLNRLNDSDVTVIAASAQDAELLATLGSQPVAPTVVPSPPPSPPPASPTPVDTAAPGGSRVKFLVLAILALLAVCAVIGVVAALATRDGGDKPTPTAAQAVVAPTATQPAAPAATVAPLPSPTPARAVPTVVATAPAAQPSPTPRLAQPTPTTAALVPATVGGSGPTEEQLSFVATIGELAQQAGASINRFGDLVDQQQQQPSLLQDDEWRTSMAVELGIWRYLYESSKDVTPPPGLEIINGKWIEVAGHLNLASDYVARGLDAGDAGLIAQGTREMELTGQGAQELAQLLEEFGGQAE